VLLDAPIKPVGWDFALAQAISRFLSPPILVLLGLAMVARYLIGATAYEWIAFYIIISVLLPVSYIIVQVQRGKITDFHMRLREQRIIPMLLTFTCALVAWGVMRLASAPYPLIVVSAIGTIQTAFFLLITLRWKISGHATAISGMAVFLCGIFGWAATPALLLIPMVAWARLRLGRHDLWQVITGSAAGAIFVIIALLLIARHCQPDAWPCY
jgi:membrane-associated phospholipid phosphatase